MVQPLLNLVDRTSVVAEFDVAKTYIAKFNGDEKTKPTTIKLLSEDCETLKPTVHFFLFTKFIFHSRESELYRHVLDGISALTWELFRGVWATCFPHKGGASH